ncbi:MAG TPA: hypothetical protein VLG38_00330, partial [Gammaproteobacteria bacterium]|nr:hypothetical protein [Gammaproteobacteria bacterium]
MSKALEENAEAQHKADLMILDAQQQADLFACVQHNNFRALADRSGGRSLSNNQNTLSLTDQKQAIVQHYQNMRLQLADEHRENIAQIKAICDAQCRRIANSEGPSLGAGVRGNVGPTGTTGSVTFTTGSNAQNSVTGSLAIANWDSAPSGTTKSEPGNSNSGSSSDAKQDTCGSDTSSNSNQSAGARRLTDSEYKKAVIIQNDGQLQITAPIIPQATMSFMDIPQHKKESVNIDDLAKSAAKAQKRLSATPSMPRIANDPHTATVKSKAPITQGKASATNSGDTNAPQVSTLPAKVPTNAIKILPIADNVAPNRLKQHLDVVATDTTQTILQTPVQAMPATEPMPLTDKFLRDEIAALKKQHDHLDIDITMVYVLKKQAQETKHFTEHKFNFESHKKMFEKNRQEYKQGCKEYKQLHAKYHEEQALASSKASGQNNTELRLLGMRVSANQYVVNMLYENMRSYVIKDMEDVIEEMEQKFAHVKGKLQYLQRVYNLQNDRRTQWLADANGLQIKRMKALDLQRSKIIADPYAISAHDFKAREFKDKFEATQQKYQRLISGHEEAADNYAAATDELSTQTGFLRSSAAALAAADLEETIGAKVFARSRKLTNLHIEMRSYAIQDLDNQINTIKDNLAFNEMLIARAQRAVNGEDSAVKDFVGSAGVVFGSVSRKISSEIQGITARHQDALAIASVAGVMAAPPIALAGATAYAMVSAPAVENRMLHALDLAMSRAGVDQYSRRDI